MDYATVKDMLDYFGSREAIQLTGPLRLSTLVEDDELRTVAAAVAAAIEADPDVDTSTLGLNADALQVEKYVRRAIEDAESIIETYLVGRYPLPVTPVPLRLRTACCDIARMQMHTDAVPEVVDKRNASSMRWLKDVAGGYAKIGVSIDNEAPPQRDIVIVAPERRFRSSDLSDQGYDL